jgi:lactose/L-arabinose transport system permease protein
MAEASIAGARTARSSYPSTRPRRRGNRHLMGWFFVGPAAALFAIFFAYPLVASLWQSLLRTNGGVQSFDGLGQYRRLAADPLVATSLFNVFLFLIIQVPLMICLALGLAYVLNQSWLKWRTGFRALYFLPAVTTLVAYSIVFRVLLTTDGGLANQFLDLFGIAPIDWLNNETWARVSVIASITWRWTGYNMVILLAGLQGIPQSQYESAAIDGAGRWRTFVSVAVPQLRPVILFTSITSTIGTLQLFDENFILTGGGPNNATLTPVVYLYKVGFRQFDFGYASAIAWLVVVIIAVLSVVQFRVMREKT